MDVLKNINNVRRTVLKDLTKKIGASENNQIVGSLDKNEFKRVLIIRPNHRLGNQLLITPLVQEITEIFPDCKIDLFVKGGIAPIIFENYHHIDRIIKLPKKHFKQLFQYIQGWLKLRSRRYDIVINVVSGSSSGRLSTKFANAKFKFYGDDNNDLQLKYSDYNHIAKESVYGFRHFLSKLGITVADKEVPTLDIKLSSSEMAAGKKILQGLIDRKEEKTICLFTYATGAKCYTESWWLQFYGRLKTEYPNFNIIEILPVENISNIAFKEPTLYSKDIREMGAVIANTDIFIGADGGVMHLAGSVKTPTLGLFSVTSLNMYTPYGNKSKGLDTNKLSIDELIGEMNKILLA